MRRILLLQAFVTFLFGLLLFTYDLPMNQTGAMVYRWDDSKSAASAANTTEKEPVNYVAVSIMSASVLEIIFVLFYIKRKYGLTG